jgi:hypothetical protein
MATCSDEFEKGARKRNSFDACRRGTFGDCLGGTNASRHLPQIEGGARALGWKCGAVADANSARGRRVTKSTDAGSGKSGATESVEVPARLINAQIGQSKSANPFCEGSREFDPSDATTADDNAGSTAVGTNE